MRDLDVVITVIVGLLLLTALVVAHEWGHYKVGRLCNIKVLEFGVGFGPKLWHTVKNGIKYSIRALPIGGFVQFFGEDEDMKHPEAFNSKPVGKRALTIAAGPVMNIFVAFIITVILLTVFGDYSPHIQEVVAGSPAEETGLMAGDKIVSMDGKTIDFDMEFKLFDVPEDADSMNITVERDGQSYNYNIPYIVDEGTGKKIIGIMESGERVNYSFFEAFALGFKWLYFIMAELLTFLGQLIFTGQGAGDVAGPVGTISIIGAAVRSGAETMLRIAAILSINLGVINLLPLPALDGGRLVFLGVEKVRGKPISREKEGYVHFIGLIALFGLMILLTYQDILRIAGA